MIYERVGKDVDLDEFDASTYLGDSFYDVFIKRKKSLLKVQLFGWTLIKPFGKEGSLKYLSLIFQSKPNILNWYGLMQKIKIGFLLEIVA